MAVLVAWEGGLCCAWGGVDLAALRWAESSCAALVLIPVFLSKPLYVWRFLWVVVLELKHRTRSAVFVIDAIGADSMDMLCCDP